MELRRDYYFTHLLRWNTSSHNITLLSHQCCSHVGHSLFQKAWAV